MTKSIEEQLAAKVAEISTIIRGRDAYFQEAAAKFVLRELCWDLVEENEGPAPLIASDLAEHLQVLADGVTDAAHRGGGTTR